MSPVALTDTVTVTYTVTLTNGEVIDDTHAEKTVTLTIGGGTLFTAVEACLFGMEPGEKRTINLDPEDAFGLHMENLVQDIPMSNFKGRVDPKPGMILSLTVQQDGKDHPVPATVLSVDEEMVKVDYNHPLAGQHVIYTINLVCINN